MSLKDKNEGHFLGDFFRCTLQGRKEMELNDAGFISKENPLGFGGNLEVELLTIS